jgi:hypothetical protein
LRFFAGISSDFTSDFSFLTALANRICELSSSASPPSPSLPFPRLRFFDAAVVTSDFTSIFGIFFELILLVFVAVNVQLFVSVMFATRKVKTVK